MGAKTRRSYESPPDTMKIALIAILSLLLGLTDASSAVYYVSTSGNDLNAGTAGLPWRTIQKAANTLVGGDTVRVQPGLYNERVTETTDGSPQNPIIYVAEGHTNVICRGFSVSGDNVWVIGFEITHATDVNYAAIDWRGGTNALICDNYIHSIDEGGNGSIQARNSDRMIFRGNAVIYAGSAGSTAGTGGGLHRSISLDTGPNDTMLLEYNHVSQVGDYLNPSGTNWIFQNNVLGPTTTAFAGGVPHVDGLQCDVATKDLIMRCNWHVDNSVADSHFILIEAPSSGRNKYIVAVKNVSLRSGDQLWYQMRDGTNLHCAHNTVGQVGYGPRGGPASSGFIRVFSDANGPSVNNESYNNIFTNVTRGSVYLVESGGNSLVHGYDLVFPPANDLVNGSNNDIEADPQFVDYGRNNVMLRSTSPAVDTGGALTTVASSSGTGTRFAVGNVSWFTDGMGLTKGDQIYVGNDNNLTITAIDRTAKTITVGSSFTWASNDKVGYAYRGLGPDRGAYEVGDTFLTGATISQSGSEYTVTTIGDTRMVVFYVDGIPRTADYTAPYTATITDGVVIAKAYAMHAQASPVLLALLADPSRPAAPRNPRIVATSP